MSDKLTEMVGRLYTRGYPGAAAWPTSATPLPMWDVECSSRVPVPVSRDTPPQMAEMDVGVVDKLLLRTLLWRSLWRSLWLSLWRLLWLAGCWKSSHHDHRLVCWFLVG